MSWVQVKSPNLNVRTSLGMCLQYVQDAFGSGWAGSYALQGWRDIVKKKHTDRNMPGGVYVPIWFEGYWDGVNYGHVAIYKDGVCWSSPYTNKGTHDQLGNIETVERIYGMKYIGWSEDIGGTTVIKKGSSMNIEEEISKLWAALDSSNRREDKRVKDINDDKFKLWKALDKSNKNADVLRKAVKELEKQTNSKVDLDDYEIQLVKKK